MRRAADRALPAASCGSGRITSRAGSRVLVLALVLALATKTVGEMIDTIRTVGVERVTLGTDFGQKANPHPAAGLQTYADALFAEGVSESDIRRMACTNPTALLGLDN